MDPPHTQYPNVYCQAAARCASKRSDCRYPLKYPLSADGVPKLRQLGHVGVYHHFGYWSTFKLGSVQQRPLAGEQQIPGAADYQYLTTNAFECRFCRRQLARSRHFGAAATEQRPNIAYLCIPTACPANARSDRRWLVPDDSTGPRLGETGARRATTAHSRSRKEGPRRGKDPP